MSIPLISELEILIVNLIVTWLCLHRKYSRLLTVIAFIIISIVTRLVCRELTRFDGDKQFNTVFTLILLLPTLFLYRDHILKKMLVFLTVWIHIFLVENVSASLPQMIFGRLPNGDEIRFILQSFLLLVSSPIVVLFIRAEFIYLFGKLSPKYILYLILNSLVWLTLLSLAKIVLLGKDTEFLPVCLFSLLATAVVMVYPLMFSLAKATIRAVQLEKINSTDQLTEVLSRGRLYEDGDELIREVALFALIYMDLDHFKQVNDSYGHQAGDIYLRLFTRGLSQLIGAHGRLYRLSGDEFAIICAQDKAEGILSQIRSYRWNEFANAPCGSFRGVSLGCAYYLQDGDSIDKLLNAADHLMYECKNGDRCRHRGMA